MRAKTVAVTGAMLLAVTIIVGDAAADGKVTITREESKPKTVEIKAGEEVRWINGSGGTAHIMFGPEGPKFYLGKEGRVKFDKPGTYDYTVHVTGTKVHQHTGTVLVK